MIDSIARARGGVAVVMDGKLLGFLVERRVGFDAVTVAGRALGRFNTEGAGARALLYASANVAGAGDA